MKRIGNIASNKVYNPQNAKPPIPFDADEADSAMERFIRQKYLDRSAKPPARHNTGSSNSDDQPPPLPPKTGSRFGFRSASSIFPMSSKARREARRDDSRPGFEASDERPPSPPRRNKQSKVFGTSVGSDRAIDMDSKLAKLLDMGFTDEKRNVAVLKGLGGNLEKSIETLMRLGDGADQPVVGKPEGAHPSRTPISPGAGITVDRTRNQTPQSSNNPFDMLDTPPAPAQPQSSQSTGGLPQPQMMTGNNPYQQSMTSNPFGLMPSQSQYSLNQAFQNMSVSSSHPLFPNHTGGFHGPQQPQHQQLYQQSMTPPVPFIPQQYYPSVIYENPAQQSHQEAGYNPFMHQQSQQVNHINTQTQTNPYVQQAAQASQSFFQSPVAQSPQQQYPHAVYDNGNPHQPQQQPQQQMNPFFNQSNPQAQAPLQSYDYQPQQRSYTQPQYQQSWQQGQPLMPQATGKADKRSILDLYNYPQLAPTPAHPQQSSDESTNVSAAIPQAPSPQQQRSVSSPVATHMAGSRNPFLSSGGSGGQGLGGETVRNVEPTSQNGSRHVSQESMSVDAGGWHNGRHSPDAWGTISARSVR